MKFISVICVFVFVVSSTTFAEDDVSSGSGNYEEDPMKMAREHNVEQIANKMKSMHKVRSNEDLTQSLKSDRITLTDDRAILTKHVTKRFDQSYLPVVHQLWNYWHNRGSTATDIDNENLMAQTGGAKEVMHSIASKLVSHTSNKITNHVGSIIKSSLVNKKSDVSADKQEEKSKSLSSSTEVVLPVSSVAKLTNVSQTKDGVDDKPLSKNSKNDSNTVAVEKPSTEVKTFVDAPPIAPMESIKVEVKGKSTAYSNFTAPTPIDGEQVRSSKIDVLKFEDGLISNDGLKKNVIDGTKQTKKSKDQKPEVKKSTHKKKNKKQKRKSSKKVKKSSKRNQISSFPKIILYQGPISKALESMLSVHSTPNIKEQSSLVNSPMSFEEATADIKRSHIPKNPEGEDEIVASEIRRSRVSKSPKKYNVKGYPDGSTVTGERKSMKSKKLKNVKGKKKFLFMKHKTIQSKEKVDNDNQDLPFGLPSFMKAFPIFASDNPMLPSAPKASNNPMAKKPEKKPDSQIFDPLKERPYKPTPLNENDNTMETENNTNLITFPSISSTENNEDLPEKEEEKDVPPSDKDDKKLPTPPPLLEIGNEKPSIIIGGKPQLPNDDGKPQLPTEGGKTPFPGEEGKTQLPDQDDDDEDDEEMQINNNKNSTAGVLTPSIVMEPLQNNPLPTPQSNSGTPNPVINLPDKQNRKPKQPLLNIERPQTIQQPKIIAIEPGNGNMLPMDPTGGMSEEEGRELLDQVDSNAQTIDTLTGEMRELETRLSELETAVNDVTEDVRKLEKKVVDKPQKQATDSFTEFVGPLQGLQGDMKRPPKIFSIFNKLRQQKQSPFRQSKRPKVLKEFFVPLPPANSPAAKAIEKGAPINGLPFPLNIIVSKILRKMEKGGPNEAPPNQPITIQGSFPFRLPISKLPLQQKPWRQPQPLPEVSFPPTEHDIDQLEMEMGKTPITRYPNKSIRKPKIIIFSKSPRIFDLAEKPCDEPCNNGGTCVGSNVCKCPLNFIGSKCEKMIQRSPAPEDILDILGSDPESDSDPEDETRKSNLMSLPLVLSNVKQESVDRDDSDDDQKPVEFVEQNKIVNMLQQLGRSLPFLPQLSKRSKVPNPYFKNEFDSKHKYEQDIVPRSEIYERYRIPGERSLMEIPQRFRYRRMNDYYEKKH